MENNLESYLAAIEAQLSDVPAARKTEFIDEVRAHLWAMWEAKRADGADAATAWLSATAEFGEPEKVGHDLLEQWASSGQLETEGAPLPKRELARKFGRYIADLAVWGAFMFLLPKMSMKQLEQLHSPLIFAASMFAMLGYGVFNFRRSGKPWTIYSIAAFALTFVMAIAQTALMQWPKLILGGFAPASMVALCIVSLCAVILWLWKRDKINRPWQWSARFKSSPIAAEQEYRLNRLVSLAIVTSISCLFLVVTGLQILGWTFTLLSCAGFIGVAIGVGRWMQK